MLLAGLVERVPDPVVIVAVEAAGEGDLGAGWTSTSVSAWRRAARKSRLSITDAVIAWWLTLEPVRGRHADPVCAS